MFNKIIYETRRFSWILDELEVQQILFLLYPLFDHLDFLIPYMMRWVNRKKEGQLFDFKYGKLYKTVVGIDKDWFPHRFRGERASQLVTETGINTILLLMKWFGWTSEKMPAHYARMSTKEIEEAYRRHEERAILER